MLTYLGLMKHPSILVLALVLSVPSVLAQPEVSLGADLVSRYVWRGLDFGQSAAVQPTIEVGVGGFSAGTWGSFGITDANANELDLYLSYAVGPVTVGVTDYHFPGVGLDPGTESPSDYFNFDDGGGGHTLEPFVSYQGEAVPLSLTLATNVYNDPDYSTYLEAGYGFAVGGVDLGLAVGAVFALDSADGTQGSGYYATSNDAAITVLSLTAAKEVPITTEFALPMFGQYIVNPETERSFLLFGISL